MKNQDKYHSILDTILAKSKKAGTDEVEALVGSAREMSIGVRNGKRDNFKRSEIAKISLSVSIKINKLLYHLPA